MALKKAMAIFFLLLIILTAVSCWHTGPSPHGRAGMVRNANITIIEGSALLRINGHLSEDLFWGKPRWHEAPNVVYPNPQMAQRGTITRNQTKHLSTGDEITFSVLPSEVIIVNIVSVDGYNVLITSSDTGGSERTFTLHGSNRLGFTISFTNR